MYKVIKELHFSYAHRLLNYEGKCARLHGHNARVQIELSSEKLNAQGMVLDFHEIKKVMKTFIDGVLDHRTILWDKDSLVQKLEEAGETVVLMKENPTAEALAKWIYTEARHQRFPVYQVTVWETHDSCASYHE